MSGQTIRNTYLPIHVTTHLGGSLATFGTIIAMSPVIELIVMPLAGLLAQRIGMARLITVGLVIGTIEYAFVASSTAIWQLYVTQAMDACVVAVVLGLGVSYAQRLSPDQPGRGQQPVLRRLQPFEHSGRPDRQRRCTRAGVPRVFLLPSMLCAASCAAFVGIERAARRARVANAYGVRNASVTPHA